MKIEQATTFMESGLQHRLHPAITQEQIAALLPGIEDEGATDDGKAHHYWPFLADGRECAIWDYRGLRWSAHGPREVFEQLGLEIIGGVEDFQKAVTLQQQVR